jgi:hypothetical protein
MDQILYVRIVLEVILAELKLELAVNLFNLSRNAFDFSHYLHVWQTRRLEYRSQVSHVDAIRFKYLLHTLGMVGDELKSIECLDKVVKSDKLKMLGSLCDNDIIFLTFLIFN